jgi:putative endonuclease
MVGQIGWNRDPCIHETVPIKHIHMFYRGGFLLLFESSSSSVDGLDIEKHMIRKKWKWYVYIIECLDGTYYTGMTWSIEIRTLQHEAKVGSRYTKKHGFKRLAYYEEHDDIERAQYRERQIKAWSQKKKKMLIEGKWSNNFRILDILANRQNARIVNICM